MTFRACSSGGLLALACALVAAACGAPVHNDTDAAADHVSVDAFDAARTDANDVLRVDATDIIDAIDASNDVASDVRDVPIVTDATDAHAGCSSNADCATGRVCCAATGACYDPGCLACCSAPPVDAGSTCNANTDCNASSYCAGTGCGTPGTCTVRPDLCSGLYDPVCGCDGTSYGNSCVAAQSGVRVESTGTCTTGTDAGPPPPVCTSNADCTTGSVCCIGTGLCYNPACLACCMPRPGACVSNATCAATEYCAGSGCGTSGTCTVRPDLCTDVYDPVCGCNGVTYSNSCAASAAGQRVASSGVCAPAVDAGSAPDSGVRSCVGVLCAMGYACCPSTGVCYDTRCLACCH